MDLFILKIGGSIATFKNRRRLSVRRNLLRKIAKNIKKALDQKKFRLIIIHGSGSAGHGLAKRYALKTGVNGDRKKWRGALLSRIANQKLNSSITEIFSQEDLRITSVHTASAIVQTNGKITGFNLDVISESLKKECVPLLYGDMVFDAALDMSICSGDAIAPYLAQKLKAQKIFFASDIDGIFTQDPHIHKKAKLIGKISLSEIHEKSRLSESHNTDVTGGLLGKIEKLSPLLKTDLEKVEIFNGFNEENFEKALLGKIFPHTVITK